MIKILILEDNLKALKLIMEVLNELEAELGQMAVTIFSEGELAEKFLKNFVVEEFDLVLLDYYSLDNKNFHQAILGWINPEKIIAISNAIANNKRAGEKGVSKMVQKKYADLIGFKKELKKEIKNILI